ncbi:MAG TPA: PilZ domain-containing protein [Candidatus Saccharimonadales bacterium]|nr:PilZ domain-containing protein [Candidatus Saccharimonadales bacterium]
MSPEVRVNRAEPRMPARIFVRLSNPEDGSFELTQTVDISLHGALVLSKSCFQLNQQLAIRSIRSAFSCFARVAHCDSRPDGWFAVGLDIYRPAPDWSR